jgi:hypothetical protein
MEYAFIQMIPFYQNQSLPVSHCDECGPVTQAWAYAFKDLLDHFARALADPSLMDVNEAIELKDDIVHSFHEWNRRPCEPTLDIEGKHGFLNRCWDPVTQQFHYPSFEAISHGPPLVDIKSVLHEFNVRWYKHHPWDMSMTPSSEPD